LVSISVKTPLTPTTTKKNSTLLFQKNSPNSQAFLKCQRELENEDKTAYEKRVRFRAIQNALAAQLAPILLGESGRTISDADRVRVIALLGGFADFSKAGVLDYRRGDEAVHSYEL
jgi:hypothetical protein